MSRRAAIAIRRSRILPLMPGNLFSTILSHTFYNISLTFHWKIHSAVNYFGIFIFFVKYCELVRFNVDFVRETQTINLNLESSIESNSKFRFHGRTATLHWISDQPCGFAIRCIPQTWNQSFYRLFLFSCRYFFLQQCCTTKPKK